MSYIILVFGLSMDLIRFKDRNLINFMYYLNNIGVGTGGGGAKVIHNLNFILLAKAFDKSSLPHFQFASDTTEQAFCYLYMTCIKS